MLRPFNAACSVFVFAACVCAAQSSSGAGQATQTPAPPTTANTPAAKDQPAAKDPANEKKKPKKVWTEDDISKVGGTISVVGDTSPSRTSKANARTSDSGPDNSGRSNQVEYYRDQVRQLQGQLDVTDKKIEDLRNFKADNSTASGGIIPNHGYSMTPIPDQIKQLEEKKKQIQDKIDAVMDEARKKGIEPGQLR